MSCHCRHACAQCQRDEAEAAILQRAKLAEAGFYGRHPYVSSSTVDRMIAISPDVPPQTDESMDAYLERLLRLVVRCR